MSACNHLFYYPSPRKVATPADAGFAYETLGIPSEDGLTLDAWWIKAAPEKRLGRLVVQLHGNAENISTHFQLVAWLSRAGYDVLSFDYRGYGESSPAEPTQEGLVADTCHVFAWLAENPSFRVLPTFVVGQSLGGAVAITSLARCPYEPLRGLVVDSSFHSYRGIARMKLASFWLSWPLQIPLSWLISDAAGSPEESIERLAGVPLLFLHSPKDPIVPYASARRLYRRAPEPKQWIDIGFIGHIGGLGDGSPYRQAVLDFFESASSSR